MSPFIVNDEFDEKACLGCGRFLSEALVATEDGALLLPVSGKQPHELTDIRTCAGGPQSFLHPVKCVPMFGRVLQRGRWSQRIYGAPSHGSAADRRGGLSPALTDRLFGVGFHDWRRSATTQLVLVNVDLKTVGTRLGHSDPRLTSAVYAQATSEADRAPADSVGQRFATAMGFGGLDRISTEPSNCESTGA